jgi:isopentenyl-diphosphate delta-isomerase
MTAREAHEVELVDATGNPVGSATVADSHQAPGMLHRAFSVFLRDSDGRVLLQQRAAIKTRFPLRWANTCCGHPTPGQTVADAAAQRLAEELGVTGITFTEVGVYQYYADDPATGRVEHEYDHVLLGDLPAEVRPQPDPDEVADLRWVTVPDLVAEIRSDPRPYAPWLRGVTNSLAGHLADRPRSGTGPVGSPRRSVEGAPERC